MSQVKGIREPIQVMHGASCVAVQILEPARTALVFSADEADLFADQLREQAQNARELALATQEDGRG